MPERPAQLTIHSPRHAARGRRHDVHWLEWVFIFPVVLALLYGIACYGLTLLVRSSMQHAVEQGAQAALGHSVAIEAPTWKDRKNLAKQTASHALRWFRWLPPALQPTPENIEVKACLLLSLNICSETPVCNATNPCLISVSYEIKDYRSHPIVPVIAIIPGLERMLPQDLKATACKLVDRRMP